MTEVENLGQLHFLDVPQLLNIKQQIAKRLKKEAILRLFFIVLEI